MSRCTSGGSGLSNRRWVHTITIGLDADRPARRSEAAIPPERPGVVHGLAEAPGQLSKNPGLSPPRPFCAAVSWSVVISWTSRGDSTVSRRQQHPGEREQVVGGRHQAAGAVAEGGRRLQRPRARPTPSARPPSRRYAVARRSVCDVQNAVSRIPSGSNKRVRSTSSNDCPARGRQHAEHRRAGVVEPALTRLGDQRKRSKPAIHVSGSGCTSGSGGPIVARSSSSVASTIGHG